MEGNQTPVNDVMKKFALFRSIAEMTDLKQKESVALIIRLKDEISSSREIEKNLRIQLAHAQNRILHMQAQYNEFLLVKEKYLKNEEVACLLETRLTDLEKALMTIKEKGKQILEITFKEEELKKNNEDLQLILKKKEADFDLQRMEIQTLISENTAVLSKHENKIIHLEEELKNSQLENEEFKIYSDKVLLMYRKQLSDYELTIQQYEQERQNFLGEFVSTNDKQKPSTSFKENQKQERKKVTWHDSLGAPSLEERDVIDLTKNSEVNDIKETMTDSFKVNHLASSEDCMSVDLKLPISHEQKQFLPKSKSAKTSKLAKPGLKQKPRLEFLSESNDNNGPTKRRRLYSTNYNHFFM